MKIATWNINSVRLRIGMVRKFLEEFAPDVLCLQETKTINDTFPAAALDEAGYRYRHIQGMKSYNGVAIISKHPLTGHGTQNWQGREDCRHIFASLPNGLEVHCCYVPAGGDVPDPSLNPKFAHKLGFLDEMAGWWKERSDKKDRILVGDLNVAPLENDVWSHKQMIGVVSHTPIEVEKLANLQKSHGWYDAVRHFTPPHEKLYSWWSYRSSDWQTSDRGRRLDHVWVTDGVRSGLKKADILKAARGWGPKPSDHVPIIVEIG